MLTVIDRPRIPDLTFSVQSERTPRAMRGELFHIAPFEISFHRVLHCLKLRRFGDANFNWFDLNETGVFCCHLS